MCIGNRPHVLAYSSVGAVADMFVPLNPAIVSGLTCDIDNTQILVHFKNASAMTDFINDIHTTRGSYMLLYARVFWPSAARH